MELRSRSRSITPFEREIVIGETYNSSSQVSVTRSTRKSTPSRTVLGEDISEEFYTHKPVSGKSIKSTRSKVKTSDYSSEEGEYEARHISQNEKNQIVEDAKAAANGSEKISALSLYRKAGRYWEKYPKTDYTYSPHSRDRVEIAPGVVQMPNMSRRSIHSQDNSTNTDLKYEQQYTTKFQQASKTNNNFTEESYHIHRTTSRRTTLTSIFTSIYTVFISSLYTVPNSSVIWLAKKFHHFVSWLMLVDTWTLRKSSTEKKTTALILLCLIPLLLFGGWYYLFPLDGQSSLIPSLPVKSSPLNPTIAIASLSNSDEKLAADLATKVLTEETLERLLENSKLYKINNDFHSTKIEFQKNLDQSNTELHKLIQELKEELSKTRTEFLSSEEEKIAYYKQLISQIRNENHRYVAQLTQKISRCCHKSSINLEPLVMRSLEQILNNPEFLHQQIGLNKWLNGIFVAKQELEWHLSNITQSRGTDYNGSIEGTAEKVLERVVNHLSTKGILTDASVKQIVKEALAIYDADKTGLVDYAMEPMGGQIITTRCTESYQSGTAVVSILGIPIWHPNPSPRTVITPGINPGECWAFQNFPGFVVIKLAARIKVTAFSIEHISRLLVPEGKIDSAPKDFEVYGFENENDKELLKIGDYVYDYEGDAIQYFTAENTFAFSMIELRIKSNHGNPNYTCLYRFRVHGTSVSEPV